MNECNFLQITSESQGFAVFVNGTQIHTFVHRGDPKNIALIEVRGDVSLQLVREHTGVCLDWHIPLQFRNSDVINLYTVYICILIDNIYEYLTVTLSSTGYD